MSNERSSKEQKATQMMNRKWKVVNPNSPRGFEQSPPALSKTPISQSDSAPDSAPKGENTPLDPDLALIQDRWPKLPEHIRQAVLSLVRSHSANG
jgi:hypothetical protein